jgi:hypothetical protein
MLFTAGLEHAVDHPVIDTGVPVDTHGTALEEYAASYGGDALVTALRQAAGGVARQSAVDGTTPQRRDRFVARLCQHRPPLCALLLPAEVMAWRASRTPACAASSSTS